MSASIRDFQRHRERMNEKILSSGNLDLKRFFALDSAVYRPSSLDAKTKELLGLVASAVLRCDDCILYHLIQCRNAGVTDAEFHETMSIALVIGGSITIPHLRTAFEHWENLADTAEPNGPAGQT
jgi:AhpD family alkylhydroperoxidase